MVLRLEDNLSFIGTHVQNNVKEYGHKRKVTLTRDDFLFLFASVSVKIRDIADRHLPFQFHEVR
jgi:hypothetical protein